MAKDKTALQLKKIGLLKVDGKKHLLTVDEDYRQALLNYNKFSHGLIFYEWNGKLRYVIGRISEVSLGKGVAQLEVMDETQSVIAPNEAVTVFDVKPYFPNEDYLADGDITTTHTTGLEIPVESNNQMTSIGHYHSEKDVQYLKLPKQPKGMTIGGYYRVFWWFNRFDKPRFRTATVCNPPYENAPKTGIFATRSPVRPNLIANTIVKVVGDWSEEKGMPVAGFDGFENTPILGVYPYQQGIKDIDEVQLPEWLNHWPRKKKIHVQEEAGAAIDLKASAYEKLTDLMEHTAETANGMVEASDKEVHDLDYALMNHVIRVKGARQNNLKNVDIDIPKNKITVITGVSGSGKSSLAFDTIHMESQRQFMDISGTDIRAGVDKPDVDNVFGLMPSIAIEQKALGNNPRSTVGTMTGMIDYLKMLYVAIGVRHCPECQAPIQAVAKDEIIYMLTGIESGHKVDLAPDYDMFGKTDVASEGSITISYSGISGTHGYSEIITEGVEAILVERDTLYIQIDDSEPMKLQTKAYCHECDRVFFDMGVSLFGYNNPEHMCPRCKGLGEEMTIDVHKVIDNPELSVLDGASKVWGDLRKHAKKPNANWMRGEVLALANDMNVDLELPYKDLPEAFKEQLLYGSGERKVTLEYDAKGRSGIIERPAEGVMNIVTRLIENNKGKTGTVAKTVEGFMTKGVCTLCDGERLAMEGRLVRVLDKRYPEAAAMSIDVLREWVIGLYEALPVNALQKAKPILDRMVPLLSKLNQVGLSYLSLDRGIHTLSGGEGQRLRLASQFGTNLTNILYVMDEPSMGLHPSDYKHLADKLKELRDNGNTIVMVEHELEMIKIADHIIDVGPRAGKYGGEIIAQGTIEELTVDEASVTGKYFKMAKMNDDKKDLAGVELERERALSECKDNITLKNARTHNLKGIDVEIPMGQLVCVTGVSGSGKSSLIADTLVPALQIALGQKPEREGFCDGIEGHESISKLIEVSQRPIGRTPRSNPATYSGVFDLIRQVYAGLDLSKERGYKKEHFSFNSAKGQCPHCGGAGQVKTVMSFMPDIWTKCYVCNGSRYQQEILDVQYKGYSIDKVLEMEIDEALELFINSKKIAPMLQTMMDVGLGYLKLGQSATTLSGGEAQRLKLAKELATETAMGSLYIFDEPTTGLHLDDTSKLIHVMKQLVEQGNTVIVVEHNMTLVAEADYIIDMGPEGGDAGGYIIAQGSPEMLKKVSESKTGQLLQGCLK